jgi:spore coat polysaccharide biosynthesis protein SpsF
MAVRKRTVTIIIQARMSSRRLPGKTLMDLGGVPVIDRVVQHAQRAKLADAVVVATSVDPTDDVLVDRLEFLDVPFVRGSLDDVLSRFVLAVEAADAELIIRITADCPLIDPACIDEVVEAYLREPPVDYCSNSLRRTYPVGMDAEVFSREVLESAHDAAHEPHEREHVTPYIYQHPERFHLRNVNAPTWAARPEIRLTLDEPRDLDLLRILVERLGPEASLRQALAALDEDPELTLINQGVEQRHIFKSPLLDNGSQ